jgi:hypothetical protein
MAKYLSKPCVDVAVKTVYIARKQDEEGEYQTYYILTGDSLDEDGKKVGDFHEKSNIGPPGSGKWDEDSVEQDVEAVAAVVKAKYVGIHTDNTVS